MKSVKGAGRYQTSPYLSLTISHTSADIEIKQHIVFTDKRIYRFIWKGVLYENSKQFYCYGVST